MLDHGSTTGNAVVLQTEDRPMIIAAMQEPGNETRVAITPSAVKHYIKLGFDVTCEQNAGQLSGFSDSEYEQAGATIVSDKKTLLRHANVVVCVNEPAPKKLAGLAPHALLIAPIDQDLPNDLLNWCCQQRISVFSMNHIPRITKYILLCFLICQTYKLKVS